MSTLTMAFPRLTSFSSVRKLIQAHPICAHIRRISLGQSFRLAFVLSLAGLLAIPSLAENQSNVSLDSNETLFTVLTAINACGYDQELNASDPLRAQIRAEVKKA